MRWLQPSRCIIQCIPSYRTHTSRNNVFHNKNAFDAWCEQNPLTYRRFPDLVSHGAGEHVSSKILIRRSLASRLDWIPHPIANSITTLFVHGWNNESEKRKCFNGLINKSVSLVIWLLDYLWLFQTLWQKGRQKSERDRENKTYGIWRKEGGALLLSPVPTRFSSSAALWHDLICMADFFI